MPPAPTPEAETKRNLMLAQQLSRNAITATQNGIGLIEVRQKDLAFGSVRGFDAASVNGSIEKIRGTLVEGLQRDELKGLRSYVGEFFPTHSLHTISLTSYDSPSCSQSACPEQLAEPESVQITFRNVVEFVDKVSQATAFKINFKVKSKPSGAKFSLQPLGGGFITEVATDGHVGSIFRGLYRYTVQRDGFKKVEATINLVDNSPDELYCELISTSTGGDPLPCLFGIIE